MARLAKKFETAKKYVPRPVVQTTEGARIGIIAVGSADQAVEEARALMASEGLPVDYLRVRAVPFTEEVETFIANHERVYVVELNRDGQLRQLLLLNMPGEYATKIISAAYMDGMPLSARRIKEEIMTKETGYAAPETIAAGKEEK